jgi:hypothetical protein
LAVRHILERELKTDQFNNRTNQDQLPPAELRVATRYFDKPTNLKPKRIQQQAHNEIQQKEAK